MRCRWIPGGIATAFGCSLLLGTAVPGQAASLPSLPLLHAEQLPGGLGYLPVTWHAVVPDQPEGSAAAWTHPPRGVWRWTPEPAILHTLWTPPGTPNVVVRGALMTFQRVQGLPVSGTLTPATRTALDTAWHQHRRNPYGYSYVLVDEYAGSQHPETLTLWHQGRVVLVSPANTGIAATPTPIGTWPVYLRYRTQTMSGITPWGTRYDDPGVPYVNYFVGGVAVHGFPRAAYGFPQSLGCVELPIPIAARVWTYLHYGTLVTTALNVSAGARRVAPA